MTNFYKPPIVLAMSLSAAVWLHLNAKLLLQQLRAPNYCVVL